MAGCKPAESKPAESLLAEREQERECGAGVSQNVGLEQVDTRVLRFYWLLCCCAGSVLGATCCWLPLLHLMEARLEFISPAAGCIIALALRRQNGEHAFGSSRNGDLNVFYFC